MKYASIYIRFSAAIASGIGSLLDRHAQGLAEPETCRFTFIKGIPECVVCISGHSDSLRSIYRSLESYFFSTEAIERFVENDDEEVLIARVYTPAGNSAKIGRWLVSRAYVQAMSDLP